MTAASLLDDQTASAIRQAIGAASRGSIAEACEIGERALAGGGNVAALNAMLGMFRCRAGDMDAGINHLRVAHDAQPADPKIVTNLATALAEVGQQREALTVLTEERARADSSMNLERLRGFLAQATEEYPVAIRCYERVVAALPSDWEAWNNLGNARRGADDAEGAVEALGRALALSPQSAPVRLNYAIALEYAGRAEEAEKEYRRIAVEFPDESMPLRELFQMLKLQYRDDDAHEVIEEAVRRAPTDVELALILASHCFARQRHAAAEAAYRRVIELEPDNSLAWLGLAFVFDQLNRTDDLAALVGEAERANVDADGLSFIKAFDHRRAKRFAEGLEELRKVPDELETARRRELLGQLLEGIGDFDGAFAAFERMNEIMRQDQSNPDQRATGYRQLLSKQIEALTPAWADSWRDAEVDDRSSPAFLVGFPRSGTTLLDTILMSHPDIEVLEEEPTLMRATEALGGFDAVPTASGEKLKEARDVYFETARALTPLEPGKLLIDKNPLAMNSLPIIRRLFPDARIILAIRHPCDVVLSCFVTNFEPINSTVNFQWLDRTAELYDLSFSNFERARELLQPPVHTVMYENVVAERDWELRPLFEFLGLPWDDRVLDHESTARNRGHIKTASYAQVVEPIYKRSAGRWHNYRKHLEPIFPALRPWVEKFAYSLDEAEAGSRP